MIQSIQFMSCQIPLNLFHARSDRRFNYVIQFMCKVWTHFLPTFCQCTCVAWQLSPRKSIGRNSRFHSCQGTGRRQSNCGLGGNHVGTKFICHGIPGSQPMSRASKLRALPFKRGLSLGGVFQGQMYGPDLPFPRTERSWRFPNIPWPRAVRKARERLQRHHVVATRQIPVAQNCCPWHGTPRPMLQRFKASRPNHNKKRRRAVRSSQLPATGRRTLPLELVQVAELAGNVGLSSAPRQRCDNTTSVDGLVLISSGGAVNELTSSRVAPVGLRHPTSSAKATRP